MNRVVITGANGSGKSHLARHIAALRHDMPVISYDALRLTRDWQKRPPEETARRLAALLTQEVWLLEGGPSVLAHALSRCEVVIWLDPPTGLRAWRLLCRPWKRIGRVRAELPAGNRDWPVEQYLFAYRSLRRSAALRAQVAVRLSGWSQGEVYRCRTRADVSAAIARITQGRSR